MSLPKKWLVLASLTACLLSFESARAAEPLLYTVDAARALPGEGHSWGFAALESARPYLFIARRENGLSVFDVEQQRLLKTLDNSAGANAVAFVPRHNRAYVANMDGSLGIVELDRLQVVRRLKLDSGNLNNLLYDASRDRVIVTSGRRGDHSTLYLIDAKTDQLQASVDLPAEKLDGPVILENGTFIVPMRDEDQVAVLSGAKLQQQTFLKFDACKKPGAIAVDEAHQRLFVACRGGNPTLIVADLLTGKALSTLPIGRAVNTLAYDHQRDQLLVPSGADASLTVIQRDPLGQYQALGAIGTRPWAHNMVLDAKRGQAYLLSADFTQPAPSQEQPKQDPVFHAGTFTVLTLKAN
ncbi:YncE family protein [Pseudomonas sp. NPDC087346]|uniref:YncE family protein n=1 Tax=Pseudomonas sp. NPDC087346 TaxID=3364438 RepID=UPI0038062542